MIFFFGDGRLGNQLFQYVFIRSMCHPSHTVVSYNFEDISALFDSVSNVINIRNKYLRYALRKFLLPIMHGLARLRLISSFKVNTYNEQGFTVPDTTFTKTTGLFPVVYVYPCFAQSETFFSDVEANRLTIKKTFLDKAEQFLAAIPEKHTKVFLHIRRTDYITFEVLGKPGVDLPLSYYQNAIRHYEEIISDPFFVFLTDDAQYVNNAFQDIPNKVVSNNSMFVDYAIITLCEYGVMSNSSFCWWAAYMMKNRKHVFAPKYWLGWKSQAEYHKGTTPSFAEIVEVNA
jgi:hypothetical protein